MPPEEIVCTEVDMQCVTCGTRDTMHPDDTRSWSAAHMWPTILGVTLDGPDGPVTYRCEPVTALRVTV